VKIKVALKIEKLLEKRIIPFRRIHLLMISIIVISIEFTWIQALQFKSNRLDERNCFIFHKIPGNNPEGIQVVIHSINLNKVYQTFYKYKPEESISLFKQVCSSNFIVQSFFIAIQFLVLFIHAP
jgi:hypothetical protein